MDATAAATTTAQATQAPAITSALRNFYQNIAGTPTSQQAEGDVTSFNKMAPTTASILSAFDQQYGVNDAATRVAGLRKSVMNAEDLVNNVENNVFSRTSNALVSDAQRARLTAAEKDPLTKQLGVINRNFELASGDLRSAQDQSNRFSSAEIGDIGTMRTSLGERLGTAQAREAEAARKAQEEEANRQWWSNFYEQKRQTDASMALRQKELDAQIRASQASTNALLSQIRATQKQNEDAERQRAIAAASASIKSTPKTQVYQGNKNVVDTGGFGGLLKQGAQNIADYGPLALFGGGSLWRF